MKGNNKMKKDKIREEIKHFIKFFIYDLKQGTNSEIYIEDVEYDLSRFLKPYIEDNHYKFSPFTEIKEKK